MEIKDLGFPEDQPHRRRIHPDSEGGKWGGPPAGDRPEPGKINHLRDSCDNDTPRPKDAAKTDGDEGETMTKKRWMQAALASSLHHLAPPPWSNLKGISTERTRAEANQSSPESVTRPALSVVTQQSHRDFRNNSPMDSKYNVELSKRLLRNHKVFDRPSALGQI